MASFRWPHPHAARWRQWLLAGSSSLLAFWSSVQISHRGKYSVERLQALDEYCKTTSLLRVLVVCCLTPVPAMALVLILECIPLRDPSEGWQRNFPTWMRVQVVSYSVAQGLMLQVLGMIPSIPMTISKSILVSVSTAVACVAVLMCLSATWVYPVPFGIVLGVLPFVIFFPFFFVLAVGRRPFLLIPNLVLQLQRQLLILLAQATLVFVYPSFNAIFTSLSLDGQLVALCVLPLIKILIKNIVAWSSAHLEDYIPEIVAFSVDVFNSLYVSACMKSAGRLLTTTLVMGFDAFQIVLALRDIRHRTTSVQRWNPSGVWKTRNGLLTDVLQLCQRPELLSSSAFQKIRLRSPIKLHLSVHGRNVLDSLVRHRAKLRGTTGTNRRRRTSVLFSGIQTRFKSQVQPWIAGATTRHLASVAPAPPTEPPRRLLSAGRIQLAESSISVPAVSLKPASVAPQPQQQEPTAPDLRNTLLELPTAEKTLLIHETLTMLFQCEYLILVEYIESTVPLLYAIYNTAIYYLPNAKYYPQMAHITDGDIVTTTLYLFGYAFMETISFLAFSFALQRRFGFSPLYLLAFVLEKQMQQLQGRLFVWVVYILPFTLKHYGVDFSFRFEWVYKKPA